MPEMDEDEAARKMQTIHRGRSARKALAANPAPKWKDPMTMSIKEALKKGVDGDVKVSLGRPVRILCLHDALQTKELLELSLGPLRAAAMRLAKVKLDLIFEDGPHNVSVGEARRHGLIDTAGYCRLGGRPRPRSELP